MRSISTIVCALVLGALFGGCIEDETTMFIEHVKSPAKAPNCVTSVGDNIAMQGLFDLAMGGSYGAHYLLNNQLKSRENSSNLDVESAGVMLEGVETFVMTTMGQAVGVSEYFEYEKYMAPNARDIAFGLAITPAVAAALAELYSCLPLDDDYYPPSTIGFDSNGRYASRYLGTVYTQSVFLGHTQSGLLLQTPEFTFPVELCCGCLVNWLNCRDECSRHCVYPTVHGMCQPGVSNGGAPLDCREIYYDPDHISEDFVEDAGTDTDVKGDGERASNFCKTCVENLQ